MWIVKEPEATLYNKGRLAMSDTQLLCSIGRLDEQTVRHILSKANHQLNELSKFTMGQWMSFDGVGASRATALVSSFEIARRRLLIQETPIRRKISCSADIYQIMKGYFLDEIVEHFYAIYLNRKNFILLTEHISKGSTNGTVVDPKIVFKKGLEVNAASMVLVHNHPSNSTVPSDADRKLTRRLVSLGNEMEMKVLDHLIFCETSYLSFADEGLL